MEPTWQRFFWLRVPAALVVLTALVQLIAMPLAQAPLRRQHSDDLALAVTQHHVNHRIVLVGDSTLRNATRKYNVGHEPDVLNLGTNALFGLPGDVLLLRRYLRVHPAPAYLGIVANPESYAFAQPIAKVHYYLWNVFRRPDERAFLKAQFPNIDSREWMPAVMDLQQKVVEPLASIPSGKKVQMDPPGLDPDPNAPLEPESTNAAMPEAINTVVNRPTTLLAPQAASLKAICDLAARYNFQILIVWSPSPKQAVDRWRRTGALSKLDDQIRAAMGSGCRPPQFYDVNDDTAYTVFDHVGAHLRGDGWEQRFTSRLGAYLRGLAGPAQPPPHQAS